MANEDPTLLGREFTAAVVLFHEAVGQALGLSAADRKCLDVLDRLGAVSAGRIAQETGLTTGAITGMIDRLERAGYVERRPNPDDRRSVLVVLRPDTPRDEVLPTVFGPLGQDMAELATRFTADELASIGRYLGATTEILKRHTARVVSSPRSRADRA
ncbi:MarR family winged helix-turn-helix transcriptional regulator [Actinomycetospora sp. CA-084318]|uniref:MarR family winged helix-turn-helix transcriptional regulator n=1 Tax=Actinomycetospora sp. CA-084318 TaxID=3239892 RepID=UPI003D98EB14